MPVYYGGDLCDSDDSEWDDPCNLAYMEHVDRYNFDAMDGMELKVFERLRAVNEPTMMVGEVPGRGLIRHNVDAPLVEADGLDSAEAGKLLTEGSDVAGLAGSPIRRTSGMPDGGQTTFYYEGDLSDSDGGLVEVRERDTLDGVILWMVPPPPRSGYSGNNSVAAGLMCHSLAHCKSFVWDPGHAPGQSIHMCCDCLCVIALFRVVMLLVHDWAVCSTRIGSGIGFCRTNTCDVGGLMPIYPSSEPVLMGGVAGGWSNVRAQRCGFLPQGSQDRVYKERAGQELFN